MIWHSMTWYNTYRKNMALNDKIWPTSKLTVYDLMTYKYLILHEMALNDMKLHELHEWYDMTINKLWRWMTAKGTVGAPNCFFVICHVMSFMVICVIRGLVSFISVTHVNACSLMSFMFFMPCFIGLGGRGQICLPSIRRQLWFRQ
jgi:hypothetical protein